MNTQVLQNQEEQKTDYSGLWRITAGQRLRYLSAIGAMVLTNLCMFGAPIIGGQAIDVINKKDFGYAHDSLIWLSLNLTGGLSYTSYIWMAAFASLAITAVGGVFLYLRGRLAAEASESISRRLRESLYERLHHVHAKFYDTADTGDLVQRCSSDVETLRVFLVSDVIEIGRAIMLIVCVVPILSISQLTAQRPTRAAVGHLESGRCVSLRGCFHGRQTHLPAKQVAHVGMSAIQVVVVLFSI